MNKSRLERAHERTRPRADIQGLRALAVIAVIADHLFAWPSGGFVGVDIFFVLSGFLITGLLLREYDRTGTISFTGFYLRRVKRIIPAAVLVLVVTLTASFFLLGRPRFVDIALDSLWALLSAANWRFAAKGTDYFQQGLLPSPVQHFWSLGVEEQFYLVWPWLLLGVLSLAIGVFHVARSRTRLIAGVSIGVVLVASLAWALAESAFTPSVAYFSTFSRAWELAIGALLAVLGSRLTIRNAIVRPVLAWTGVAGILVSLFVVPESPGFPAPWALLPVLSTALVITAGVGGERLLAPLTNRVSTYIGDISYSLYLWHFPVLVLLVALLPSGSIGYYASALVLTVALSVASYHWVENPARRLTWTEVRQGRRRLVPAARRGWQYIGVASLAVVAILIGGNAIITANTPPVTVVAAGDSGTITTTSGVDVTCLGAAALDPKLDCPPSSGDQLYPNPSAAADDTAGAFDCWIDSGKPFRSCSYGTGSIRVALVGDSHAASLLPALKLGAKDANWTIDSFVGYACQWTAAGAGHECDTARNDIVNKLMTGTPYDYVIVSASRDKTAPDKAWVARQYAKAWQPVADRGSTIIAVADNPTVTDAAIECVSRVGFSAADTSCSMPAKKANASVDPLIGAAKLVTGAVLVNMNDLYCTKTSCPMVIGNVMVYRDSIGHVTGTYDKTMAPYLMAAIQKAVGTK